MPKISIIIPVYNCEKYIEKCIDSVICQSFKDLEIILVDDGSSDKSGEICDEYLKKDSRVKAIYIKNQGPSVARNAGLDIAKGEYIGFIDSDDYIEKNMFEILYNNLLKYDCDISVCEVAEICDGENMKFSNSNNFMVLDIDEAMKLLISGKCLTMYAVNKLYKKSLFDNVRFPVGKLYEDSFTTPRVFAKANKVVYTPENLYYYVRTPMSITTSKFSTKDMDIIESGESILDFVKDDFPKLIYAAEFRYMWSYLYVLDRMVIDYVSCENKEYKKVTDFISKNFVKMLFNPYFSFKRRLSIIVWRFSPKIYKKLIISNIKKKKF